MASRLTRSLARQIRSLASNQSSRAVRAGQGRLFSTEEQDDIVKQTFVNQQTQFRSFLGELKKVPIPFNPNDDAAVTEYAESLKNIKISLGIPSATEQLASLLESAAEEATTVRQFLESAQSIREELDIPRDSATESLLTTLDSVEAKLGKELKFDDAEGLKAWSEATLSLRNDVISSLFNVGEGENLEESEEKYVEELENTLEKEIVRADVADYEKLANETIKTYQKRDGLEHVKIDLKELDPRTYL